MAIHGVYVPRKNQLYGRVFQEELIDTKFADFSEGLVTAFSRYSITCKNTYNSYGSNGKFISLVLETQAL